VPDPLQVPLPEWVPMQNLIALLKRYERMRQNIRQKNWAALVSCLSRLLKVIGTDADRSGTHDLQLTFHSNLWPALPKIAIFPEPTLI